MPISTEVARVWRTIGQVASWIRSLAPRNRSGNRRISGLAGGLSSTVTAPSVPATNIASANAQIRCVAEQQRDASPPLQDPTLRRPRATSADCCANSRPRPAASRRTRAPRRPGVFRSCGFVQTIGPDGFRPLANAARRDHRSVPRGCSGNNRATQSIAKLSLRASCRRLVDMLPHPGRRASVRRLA